MLASDAGETDRRHADSEYTCGSGKDIVRLCICACAQQGRRKVPYRYGMYHTTIPTIPIPVWWWYHHMVVGTYHTYIPPYQGSMVPLVPHRFSFCLRHRHVLAENDCVVSSRSQLFAHILRFYTPASPRLPWIITGNRHVVRTIDVTRKRFGEIREIKKAD